VKDPIVHLLLFVAIVVPIVVLSGMYADRTDDSMLKALPKRLLMFFGGLAVLIVLMLVVEHTFASTT